MSFEEKLQLLMKMKKVRITFTMLSSELGCTVSWISQHFADKAQMSEKMEQQMIDYINNYNC